MIKDNDIAAARAALCELQEKEKEKTAQRALEELRDAILAARSKGYDEAEIRALVAREGITVSASTLRRSIRDTARARSSRKQTKIKRGVAPAPQ